MTPTKRPQVYELAKILCSMSSPCEKCIAEAQERIERELENRTEVRPRTVSGNVPVQLETPLDCFSVEYGRTGKGDEVGRYSVQVRLESKQGKVFLSIGDKFLSHPHSLWQTTMTLSEFQRGLAEMIRVHKGIPPNPEQFGRPATPTPPDK